MENSSALATPTTLPLVRTCFTSEQDRLNVYAEHLRISVESGLTVHGEDATQAQIEAAVAAYFAENPPPAGPQGDRGLQAEPTVFTLDLAAGIDTFDVDTEDVTAYYKLVYEHSTPETDPGVLINIMACMALPSIQKTRVYFSAVTPDAFYKLVVILWQ